MIHFKCIEFRSKRRFGITIQEYKKDYESFLGRKIIYKSSRNNKDLKKKIYDSRSRYPFINKKGEIDFEVISNSKIIKSISKKAENIQRIPLCYKDTTRKRLDVRHISNYTGNINFSNNHKWIIK